jgi:sugar/nucleoside kinase (ribokinase family)
VSATVNVRVGFVPTYRHGYSDWCKQMREESLAALAQIRRLGLVAPHSAPDGESVSAEHGYTRTGAVSTLDEAEVIDTTGAGDVFHGAFLVGLQHGWPLRDIVSFSSAVSALKCTQLGGRAGIPTMAEALAFLKERGILIQGADSHGQCES